MGRRESMHNRKLQGDTQLIETRNFPSLKTSDGETTFTTLQRVLHSTSRIIIHRYVTLYIHIYIHTMYKYM